MDYFGIAKRAWDIVWRHKILWLFGFFATAGLNFSYRQSYGGKSNTPLPPELATLQRQLEAWAMAHLTLLIVLGVVLLVVGIAFLVLGVAAQGGLIHLGNEADEGREVRGGEGWSVGFHRWGRVFLVLLLIAIASGVVGAALGLFLAAAALGGPLVCGALPVFFLALVALAVIASTWLELSLRHAVLDDRNTIDSLTAAWNDMWRTRGAAFAFFGVMFLFSLVFIVIAFVVLFALGVPAALVAISGNYVLAGVFVLVAFLILVLPSAIYRAFYSVAWTIFFRRLRSLEAAAAPAPAAPGGYGYPPSQTPPAPPAPPAAPPAPGPGTYPPPPSQE